MVQFAQGTGVFFVDASFFSETDTVTVNTSTSAIYDHLEDGEMVVMRLFSDSDTFGVYIYNLDYASPYETCFRGAVAGSPSRIEIAEDGVEFIREG